jgi:hypothetical protein
MHNKIKLLILSFILLILLLSVIVLGDDKLVIEMFDKQDKTLISICDNTFTVCDRLLVPNERLKSREVEDWADMIFKNRIKQ